MQDFDVLSYGTIGLDRIYSVPHWPHADISTHTSDITEHLGGKAANTAVFLGAWGLNVALAGTILGTDQVGQEVNQRLHASNGIDVSYIENRDGLASMHCLIFVKSDGERAIVGVNTDGHPCTPVSIEMIERSGCLTLDLYGGDDRVEAARLAQEVGCPVVVGDLRRSDHPVIQFATVAIASAPELRREYPGRDIRDFALEVLAKGPEGVLISDSGHAAMLLTHDHGAVWLQPPVVDVLDTTGAGDALRAGVVYGLVKSMSLTDCAKLGLATGSLAVTTLGACTSPPMLEEVKNLAKSILVSE